MTAAVIRHPHDVSTEIAWALNREADTEIRRAAITLLVEIERHNRNAARALDRIDSTDPLGLMLRYEARQAAWADGASEILPVTADARRIAQRMIALNAPAIRRDRALSARPYVMGVFVAAGVLAGLAMAYAAQAAALGAM